MNASRICEDVSSRKRREVGNANMLLCEFINVSFSYKLKTQINLKWIFKLTWKSKFQCKSKFHHVLNFAEITRAFLFDQIAWKQFERFCPAGKKRKIQLITGVDCIAPFISFLFMEYVIVPGRKGTVMKRIITFDKKVRLIIFNLPDFLLILKKIKAIR